MHFKQSFASLSWKWLTHQRSYRAVLFWCDSIVRSGWLNAVPSQHCSLEALKHFGDKHRLAVKRATEEKAYQMSSQWAVSCIIRPGPQIRWRLEVWCPAAELCPPALPCDQAAVPAALWNSAGSVFRSPPALLSYPAMRERLELSEGEREGQFGFRYSPFPFSCSAFWG